MRDKRYFQHFPHTIFQHKMEHNNKLQISTHTSNASFSLKMRCFQQLFNKFLNCMLKNFQCYASIYRTI